PKVHVQLHDPSYQHVTNVATIPTDLIWTYLPNLATRIETNPSMGYCTLKICIPNLNHVGDIEKPALKWMFDHLNDLSRLRQNWACLPAIDSTGEGFLLYRALRLLELHDAATDLRTRVMDVIQEKPLTSYDVQRLWWSFQHTPEWSQWLDALLLNLIRYK
ncbi:hypothetical protein CC80DRAFT_363057, partial [Byssothecium circinans]